MESLVYKNLKWTIIEQTSYRDVEWLEQNFHFHPLDLKDCIGVTQRPKIDLYDDYLFLVFHFPQYDREQRRIRIQELNVFIGQEYVITLTNEPIPALRDYFNEYREKINRDPEYKALQNSSGYLLYKILDRLFSVSQPAVDIIGEKLTLVEEEIFGAHRQNATMDLSIVRRNILTYQKIFEPQLHILDRLVRLRRSFLPDELSVYYDDIHDSLERTWSIIQGYREIVSGLDRTNEALASQRLNDIIKTLTVISVVTIVPSMIINIYSMNIRLPFATNTKIFFILTGIFFLIMLATYLTLRKRKLA